jgi:(p)ppGpp synthase/HD superfamily hydrolase
MIAEAKQIAAFWHGSIDHRRKYSGLPYTVHTTNVADIVARHGGTPHQIAAAHLHDTIEDTPLTLEGLKQELIDRGVRYVDADIIVAYTSELTDVFDKASYPAYNRKDRKELERARQARMSDEAKAIKMADCIDNGVDILGSDPGFARVYVSEIRKLFPLIKDAHKGLADELKAILWPNTLDYSI